MEADPVLEALATTRAIRRFRDEPIPDQDLARIMFAATRAPTGSNRQTFRFVVLGTDDHSQTVKAVLGESFRQSWASKAAGDRYDEGSGRESDSPKARMARTMQQFVDRFEATPVVVLACIGIRHGGLMDGASIYPACQNLLVAARALGYGGVLTGWHAAVEAEVRELCAIPDGVAIAATIALGRPEGRHGPVRRRPISELVYSSRWGASPPWAVDPPGTRFTSGGPPVGERAET